MRRLACLLLTFCCGAVMAQQLPGLPARCNDIMNSQAAAIAAEDFLALEQLSQSFIDQCSRYASRPDLADGYDTLGMAQFQNGKLARALASAQRCVALQYELPGCHITMHQVQAAQGKRVEAGQTLDRAERLAAHGLEVAKRAPPAGESASERSLRETIVRLRQSQVAQIARLRTEQSRADALAKPIDFDSLLGPKSPTR